MLSLVFTNGVTIEYISTKNIHEYALQASGDREYPYFTIEGELPKDFMTLDKNINYDDSTALDRLNRVPFTKNGYTRVIAMNINSVN